MLSTFIGIILFVATIGFAVWALYSFAESRTGASVIASILCIAALIAFIIVPFSLHTVDSGKVAVVKQFGEAKEVREPGLHYDFWMTKSYQRIDTKVRTLPVTTMAYSSDAQVVTVTMDVQYQIQPDKAIDIVKSYGNTDALALRVTSIVTEQPKSVLSSHTAMDIIANRSSMTTNIEQVIRDAIGDEYMINIVAVAITDFEFSETFEQAVEDKMVAEQTKLKADYENQTKVAQAKAEADAKLKTAQAEIEIAKANAEAKILEAEAEAKANELLEKSLTDKIMQQRYIERWNGVLPSVVAGEDAALMIPSTSK